MKLVKNKNAKYMLKSILMAAILCLFVKWLIIPNVFAAESKTVSLDYHIIGEGNDFATQVLGLPWDMKSNPYPDYITVFDNFDRNTFSEQDGLWSIDTKQLVPYDPNIWLLSPGIENTQKVLRIGDRFPIDTSIYRLLSIHMCSDIPDFMNFYWYLTQFMENPSELIVYSSQYVEIQQGCHLYVINLEIMPTLDGSWDGMVRGLRVDPGVTGPVAHLDLDWARLTTLDTTNVVPIMWEGVPSGSTLNFYLNSECSLDDAMPIGEVDQAPSPGVVQFKQ